VPRLNRIAYVHGAAQRVAGGLLDATKTLDDIDKAALELLTASEGFCLEQTTEASAILAGATAAPDYPQSLRAALICRAIMAGGCGCVPIGTPQREAM
tara:strand:+ start:279 stop:572 length:294 start_codon:yes stop_codon:yes gene_type:complete